MRNFVPPERREVPRPKKFALIGLSVIAALIITANVIVGFNGGPNSKLATKPTASKALTEHLDSDESNSKVDEQKK